MVTGPGEGTYENHLSFDKSVVLLGVRKLGKVFKKSFENIRDF